MKLAECSMGIGKLEGDKKDLQVQLNKVENKAKEEARKAGDELQTLEQQLILTKMSLAEAQVEIETLRRQLKGR